jgi:transcriptional regulator of arginine metabolism
LVTTSERRAAIQGLIAESSIKSQAELRYLLHKRGFDASQPVLSRDLRALRVAKRGGAYTMLEEERVTPLTALRSLVRSSATASHFVLVRCEPGAASAVARALEAEELPGVVGTVAGDDTALVATSSQSAARRVRQRVAELV